jgi:lipoate-protein ligase A
MSSPGYFIQAEEVDGASNMAIDEVLWTEAERGTPFVRLYGWADRPVVSLGYFQRADDVRLDPRLHDLPYVRRLTGGGAIVHDHEITYSLALPAALAPGTNALYGRVHGAIAASLVHLGIPVSIATHADASDPPNALCFRRNDRFALLVRGTKVLGSAQRRRPASVLMHGSLLLARSSAAPQVLGLRDILDSDWSIESIRYALFGAMSTAFDLDLRVTELSADLRRQATALAESKYRTNAWNERVRATPQETTGWGRA